MTHPSKRKGDRAELEAAHILSDLTGFDVKRALGAGRAEDCGDLYGLPELTVEVKNVANLATAITDGLNDAAREQRNARTPFGAAMIRRRGGTWFVAMTPEQFCTLYREAL